jgi:hypothetical protein
MMNLKERVGMSITGTRSMKPRTMETYFHFMYIVFDMKKKTLLRNI